MGSLTNDSQDHLHVYDREKNQTGLTMAAVLNFKQLKNQKMQIQNVPHEKYPILCSTWLKVILWRRKGHMNTEYPVEKK